MIAERLERGKTIGYVGGRYQVPDCPVIGCIDGDGIGPEISRAARSVLDEAVAVAYGEERKIVWHPLEMGQTVSSAAGSSLPKKSLEYIGRCRIVLKGPLATPTGGGIRSLNVALRRHFDLYACIRPIRHYEGVPSPLRHPELVDVVIFRENTEDLYTGIEWAAGSLEAGEIAGFLHRRYGTLISPGSAIGIKPMSREGSKRLIRRAIKYAIDHRRRVVTLVHKGNIMKYTEGGFCRWGYELAREEFSGRVFTELDVAGKFGGTLPSGGVLLNDRICDAMFQEMLLHPERYDVLATPNLNGDYLSDACAAEVGGLGMAPGCNVGDGLAIFEATHGTAPDLAGRDRANPSSLILSGMMMLNFLGWSEAADLVEKSLRETISKRRVTSDLAVQMENAEELGCSAFAEALIGSMRHMSSR